MRCARYPFRGLAAASGRPYRGRHAVGRGLLSSVVVALVAAVVLGAGPARDATGAPAHPIRLHPENPNVFSFRGRPTLLVASGEHYGALVNLDFDYVRYFAELQRHGFNVTRVFTGTYVEPLSSNPLGHENTLSPRPGRYLAPWARASEDAEEEKYDLARWNEAYFARLRSLVAEAGRRGVVVELTLFSVYYNEDTWRTSPLYVANNVNGIGARTHQQVYRVAGNGRLLGAQEALVRKLVRELRGYDNVIFEVMNEPWGGPCDHTAATCSIRRWQDRIVSLIWEAERGAPRHLIAEDVGHGATAEHGTRNLEHLRPHPRVSVLQYHYAPPAAARENLDLRRVLGDNETGLLGLHERPYRTEGWRFLLAGGGLFNNLDWGYTPTDEAGDSGEFRIAFAPYAARASSGGELLQKQIAFLRRFVSALPFVRMRPQTGLLAGSFPAGVAPAVLADPGRAYAVYLAGGPVRGLRLQLPAGVYRLTWADPAEARTLRTNLMRHSGGWRSLVPPGFAEDLAFAVRRVG